jgi:hypothetical protein
MCYPFVAAKVRTIQYPTKQKIALCSRTVGFVDINHFYACRIFISACLIILTLYPIDANYEIVITKNVKYLTIILFFLQSFRKYTIFVVIF